MAQTNACFILFALFILCNNVSVAAQNTLAHFSVLISQII